VRAVLLAGGEGTRLRPLTSALPKPLLPVVNRPLLEHAIDLLRRHDVTDLVVAAGYRAEALREYFGDGAEHGVCLRWAVEESPLGTAGSLRAAMAGSTETFLVVSGDVVCDVDLGEVVAFHRARGAQMTVGLAHRGDPHELGIVLTGRDGRVERVVEKPAPARVVTDTVNTGLYVLEPGVLDAIPTGRPVDVARELLPGLLARGWPVYGFSEVGYWEDVGTLDAYLRVHRDLLDGRVSTAVGGFDVGGRVWLGEDAEVDPTATITGPAVLGASCRIGPGAAVGTHTVLGSNVVVGADTTVERSVVHDNVYIGPGAVLRAAVVGRGVRIRRGARLEEGSVVGVDCVIGEDATLKPGVAVYPAKTVDPGVTVSSSVVWESRATRTLIGPAGVVGLANVDVTPELAVRLAMAFATTLRRGARVAVSRDTSRAARVVERAIMVGLNAAGADVVALEVATVPVTRFAVREGDCDGGVTVRLVPGDPQSVSVRFLDRAGIDLSPSARTALERVLARQDVRRALAGELGDMIVPGRLAEDYTSRLCGSGHRAGPPGPSGRRVKVVLDYAYGASSFVMPNVLAKLGADVLSLNPYASTRQALDFDRFEHAGEVARLVLASGAALGAVIDSDGERITFVDETGHVLSDAEGMVAVVALVLESAAGRGGTAVLPVSCPLAAEATVRDLGGTLVPSGLGPADILAAAGSDAVVAASADGAYAFPRLMPAFDAVAALVTVLGLLRDGSSRLSEVIGRHPVGVLAHRRVAVPRSRTAAVMRVVLESCAGEDLVLVEGVKARFPDGWALVAPDAEPPVVHVWAEAPDGRLAEDRVAAFSARVEAAAASQGPETAGSDSGIFGA
jgi:mannose-1-phosphate guanylyltransferase/phosphomannomutase